MGPSPAGYGQPVSPLGWHKIAHNPQSRAIGNPPERLLTESASVCYTPSVRRAVASVAR